FRSLSRATVSLRVAAGRALYDALAWAGATDVDPFRHVRLGRNGAELENTATSRVYSEIELNEMLAVARDAEESLLVLLGAHAGLRVSEMLALEWSSIDLASGELMVLQGKGGKTAAVLLSPRLAAELASYRARVERSEAGPSQIDSRVLTLRSQYGVYNRLR